ncbi:MAG: helicase-exonuclease AddAB subunit AddA [Ruminococcaceae bacterium]|nr:helicase-exonuclease AddAB subunit AddA [Oscillospiraceae bacterium]
MPELTDQQKAAVYDRGGKLLVSAAAGSGKTMVLVERLMQYVLDPVAPANIDDFLIITYTKAAASELRQKISKKLNDLLAQDGNNRHLQRQLQRLYLAKISTVHGFCTDVLRENAFRLDIPGDFRVAEEDECAEMQELVLQRLLEERYTNIEQDGDFRAVVDTQGFGRDDRRLLKIIYKIYKDSRCHTDPDAWLDKCVKESEIAQITDASQTQWGEYLITDLHHTLDLHIAAMRNCAELAAVSEGMEKPSILLFATIEQMTVLRSCNTWEAIHDHLISDYGKMNFGKKADPELSERIKAVRNACKSAIDKKQKIFSYDNDQVLFELRACAPVVRGLVSLVKEFAARYSKRKQSRRVLDFADLEHKTLDLFYGKSRTGITATAYEIGKRFREVMVDEYQDSHAVQEAIFAALTEERNNCFMVGDVKQSIYGFRLAEPNLFLNKYHDYLPAEKAAPGQGRKVLLTKNFRSSAGVVSGVNDVFTKCMSPEVGGLTYGADERLNGVDEAPPQSPEVEFYAVQVEKETYPEEAAFVAGKIHELLKSGMLVRDGKDRRPIKPEDIAILLRSYKSVGGEFAYALQKYGISCAFDGEQNVLQAEETQFFRSLLQVIDNPLQDIPLVAVMMSRVFAFTADALAEMRKGNIGCPIFSLLSDSEQPKAIKFYETLMKLRDIARDKTVTELLEHILYHTNADSIFAACNGNTGTTEAFMQIAAQAERIGHRDVRGFLSYLDALDDRGIANKSAEKADGKVTILSIHKSKGLEYPVVFLCALAKGFNHDDLKQEVLCDKEQGLGVTFVDTKNRLRYPSLAKRAIMVKKASDSLSEEMCVLYVAMTRAKDRLIMTYASRYLERALSNYALRTDMSGGLLMSCSVSSMGQWVLHTAMDRIEAGELFAIGGRPAVVRTDTIPWKIRVVSGNSSVVAEETLQPADKETLTEEAYRRLERTLSFTYPFEKSTVYPSKQTATQLKGRVKDQEAAQNTREPIKANFDRKPSFAKKSKDSLFAGSATHKVLQYLRFDTEPTAQMLEGALQELCDHGRIHSDELSMIRSDEILRFFQTPLGRKLYGSKNVLREFKFSILADASRWDIDLCDEKILLQGVVDCAIIEPDGITIIDFKTDRVTEESVASVAEGYIPQISAYADAMARIYQMPIKRSVLYFFSIGKEIEVL